jgi:hypothetical protein
MVCLHCGCTLYIYGRAVPAEIHRKWPIYRGRTETFANASRLKKLPKLSEMTLLAIRWRRLEKGGVWEWIWGYDTREYRARGGNATPPPPLSPPDLRQVVQRYREHTQGADSLLPSSTVRVAKTGKHQLYEEITPLLPTGIGERFSQTISNLGHAALLRRCCELPL